MHEIAHVVTHRGMNPGMVDPFGDWLSSHHTLAGRTDVRSKHHHEMVAALGDMLKQLEGAIHVYLDRGSTKLSALHLPSRNPTGMFPDALVVIRGQPKLYFDVSITLQGGLTNAMPAVPFRGLHSCAKM